MCVSLCLCLYQHEHHSFVLLACFCNSDLEVVCFYVVIVFPFGGLFCFEGIPCHAKYHRFKRKERKKEKKKKMFWSYMWSYILLICISESVRKCPHITWSVFKKHIISKKWFFISKYSAGQNKCFSEQFTKNNKETTANIFSKYWFILNLRHLLIGF